MSKPQDAAIEAAISERLEALKRYYLQVLADNRRSETDSAVLDILERKGYEAAKPANDLALQLAYESGKEAAEWVKCEDRLPSESGLYDVTIVARWKDDFGDNCSDISVRHNVFFHTNMLPKLLPRETIVAWKNRDEPYTGE